MKETRQAPIMGVHLPQRSRDEAIYPASFGGLIRRVEVSPRTPNVKEIEP